MKIIIERTKTGFSPLLGVNQNSASYVMSVLMHINHHGWVKDLTVAKISAITERITVTMLPQGTINPPDLVPEIRDVISRFADLKIICIEEVRNRIKIPGLEFLSKSPDEIVTYQVHIAYAKFLAIDLSNAAKCLKTEVFDVYFLLEEAEEPGKVYQRGTACISSRKSMIGGQKNAFNIFAEIVMKDPVLRQRILDDLVDEIKFIVKPNGSSTVSLVMTELAATCVITSPTGS